MARENCQDALRIRKRYAADEFLVGTGGPYLHEMCLP